MLLRPAAEAVVAADCFDPPKLGAAESARPAQGFETARRTELRITSQDSGCIDGFRIEIGVHDGAAYRGEPALVNNLEIDD